MGRTTYLLVAVLGAISVVTACARGLDEVSVTRRQAAEVVSPGTAASEVSFTVDDSTISGPDSASSGWVRILIQNTGQSNNNLALVQLSDGKTAADLATHLQEQPTWPLPPWATPAGGVADVGPGLSGNVFMNLEPGSYGIVRFVSDATGVSRPAASPVLPLTVTPGESAGVEPVPGVVFQITDSKYNANPIRQAVNIGGVAIPMKAGSHIVKVVNETAVPQELRIIDIEGLTSPSDLEGWRRGSLGTGEAGTNEAGIGLHMGRVKLLPVIGEDGVGPTSPPPGTAIGGVMALQPNKVAYVSTEFKIGYLVLYSALPEPESGKPYFLVGVLVQDVEVRR